LGRETVFSKNDEGGGEMKEFDFNEWAELAKNDPEAFEAKRKEVIAEVIDGAPEKERAALNRLQWKIDAQRRIAKNPLDSCVRIYCLLLENVYKEGGFIDAITSLSPEKHSQLRRVILPKKSLGGKRIIPFRG